MLAMKLVLTVVDQREPGICLTQPAGLTLVSQYIPICDVCSYERGLDNYEDYIFFNVLYGVDLMLSLLSCGSNNFSLVSIEGQGKRATTRYYLCC